MKTITVDASCAIGWLFAEQRTAACDQLLREAGERRFVAPDILAWELANFISKRGRQGQSDPAIVLGKLSLLAIEIAAPRAASGPFELIRPAMTHGLSLFDTAYLLNALGHGGGLASRDGQLLEAAIAMGVDVFDLRD